MPRAKGGPKTRQRRKKRLKLAKGQYGGRSRLFRTATESVDKGQGYAYVGRKRRKRDFRRLWVARISAAIRQHGLTYSRFINAAQEGECAAGPQGCSRTWRSKIPPASRNSPSWPGSRQRLPPEVRGEGSAVCGEESARGQARRAERHAVRLLPFSSASLTSYLFPLRPVFFTSLIHPTPARRPLPAC